ncbi:hypothetical protein Mal64_05890 [Pseudobythopirellula maris]|uniref:Uncharacterized protein n=1 Tax=Pseudobythopirellula maris TaxID=2527991 RepID=A0A5C5ZT42_9BACT|nr:hypothetical protein [Pseudobythopirellula maris]TWT90205.1 hypothetical protein Mal64_05890 [Pseudobythopirellula maris]
MTLSPQQTNSLPVGGQPSFAKRSASPLDCFSTKAQGQGHASRYHAFQVAMMQGGIGNH